MQEREIGVISHYYNHLSVGIVELTGPLRAGDTVHIKGAHDDFTQTVDSIEIEHEKVKSAVKGDSVGIKISEKVHPHDKVFLVSE